jgi:outer membrane protein
MLSTKLIKSVSFVAAAAAIGLSPQANAVSQGDWLVRFGAVSVNPNDSSGQVGAITGSGVSVNSSVGIFANLTYMLRDNIGLEVLAATPFSHDINATGSIAGLGKIAEVKQLPPTISVQYHFLPKSDFRPYVGAGINYTTFFNAKTTGSTVTSISLDDSWGLAAQAGFDKDISKDWFFNADLRYIKIKTTATTNVGNVDVTIDPWVISIGVGTRF